MSMKTKREELLRELDELEAQKNALEKENMAMEAIMPFMKTLADQYAKQYSVAAKIYLAIIKGAQNVNDEVREAEELVSEIESTKALIGHTLTGLGYNVKW